MHARDRLGTEGVYMDRVDIFSVTIERFLAPPKPKMTSLVELIERAKAARKPTDPSG